MEVASEIQEILEYKCCCGAKAPLKASYMPGSGRLLVITGDNASGKSLFARLLSARAKQIHNLETMRISMELRSSAGIHQAFVYGDEAWQSTGIISVHSITGGIKACRTRTNPHVILFDEPDVGLSEGYQAAVGSLIAKFTSDMPTKTQYCVVVTHSRRLVRQLVQCKPHFLRIGDSKTLEEFLQEPRDCSIADLLALKNTANERFRTIAALMEENRKGRKST